MLYQFRAPEDLARWELFSDEELGGKSTISLQPSEERPVRCVAPGRAAALRSLPLWPPPQAGLPPLPTQGTADLAGHFSREVGGGGEAEADPGASPARRMKRSGFAGMRIQAAGAGGEPLNLDDYDSLVFRVFGDGRKYIANIRCESWIVDEQSRDIWQAFLFARWGERGASRRGPRGVTQAPAGRAALAAAPLSERERWIALLPVVESWS